MPWLLRASYGQLDPEVRKAFEVALHSGSGLALTSVLRDDVEELLTLPWARAAAFVALAVTPSALAGYLLERPVERRLGTPGTVALGLIAGGVAMAWADRRPQQRGWREASFTDAVWLGLAQACALFPGISRGGATLAAARRRGFTRPDAHRLSRQMALPVITGAAALKGVRLGAHGLSAELRAPFVVGAAASFASTLASKSLLRLVDVERPLAPLAAYRIVVGALVLLRLRSA